MAAVEAAVVGFVQYSKRMDLGRYGAETRNLMDEFRKDRTSGDFRPTGDSLLDDDGGK